MSRFTKIIVAILTLIGGLALAIVVNLAITGRRDFTSVTDTIENTGVLVIVIPIAAVCLLSAFGLVIAHLPPKPKKRAAIGALVCLSALALWFVGSGARDVVTHVAGLAEPERPVSPAEITQLFERIAAHVPSPDAIAERPCRDDDIWKAAPQDEKATWFGQGMVWAWGVSYDFLLSPRPDEGMTHPNIRRAFFGNETAPFRRDIRDLRYLAVIRSSEKSRAVFIVDTQSATVICQTSVTTNVRDAMRRISRVVRVSL